MYCSTVSGRRYLILLPVSIRWRISVLEIERSGISRGRIAFRRVGGSVSIAFGAYPGRLTATIRHNLGSSAYSFQVAMLKTASSPVMKKKSTVSGAYQWRISRSVSTVWLGSFLSISIRDGVKFGFSNVVNSVIIYRSSQEATRR